MNVLNFFLNPMIVVILLIVIIAYLFLNKQMFIMYIKYPLFGIIIAVSIYLVFL